MLQNNINFINSFLDGENKAHKERFGENKYLYMCENGFLIVCVPISLKVKIPTKKAINSEWLINKLNIDNTFKNISDLISQTIKFKSLNVYPTSYGIGVFLCFGYKEALKEDINEIEAFLNKNQIEFKTEYSLKNWVYRFKISKSKDNLKILENFKK